MSWVTETKRDSDFWIWSWMQWDPCYWTSLSIKLVGSLLAAPYVETHRRITWMLSSVVWMVLLLQQRISRCKNKKIRFRTAREWTDVQLETSSFSHLGIRQEKSHDSWKNWTRISSNDRLSDHDELNPRITSDRVDLRNLVRNTATENPDNNGWILYQLS